MHLKRGHLGDWPNVIGPQGDFQLSEDLSRFLDAPLKLTGHKKEGQSETHF